MVEKEQGLSKILKLQESWSFLMIKISFRRSSNRSSANTSWWSSYWVDAKGRYSDTSKQGVKHVGLHGKSEESDWEVDFMAMVVLEKCSFVFSPKFPCRLGDSDPLHSCEKNICPANSENSLAKKSLPIFRHLIFSQIFFQIFS